MINPIQVRDNGAGSGAGAVAANASSRNQGSMGGGVATLSGKKDDNVTDSGNDGVNAGGIGGDGGGQGGGGGDGDGGKEGEGQGGGGEENGDGSEELDIAAKGRRRARIIRKVDIAVKRGKVRKAYGLRYCTQQ